jgi:hypothetical protein
MSTRVARCARSGRIRLPAEPTIEIQLTFAAATVSLTGLNLTVNELRATQAVVA